MGQVEIPPGQIRLMFNENPYGPSPKALAAVAKILPKTAYYPGAIEDDLMGLFMARHQLDREQVFLASGSNEGLQAAMMAFGKRGKVISPTPDVLRSSSIRREARCRGAPGAAA